MTKYSPEQEDDIISEILYSFEKYNLRDIKEINSTKQELEFTIAVFILCSCIIDHLSGFRYATDRVKYRYIKFVQEYLPQYDAEELNNDLRNRLVHNYSLGGYYALTRSKPQGSFKIPKYKILNLDDFIIDLENCLKRYRVEVQTDPQIRHNALQWYDKYKIIKLAF